MTLFCMTQTQGLYSLRGKTSYCQISRSLEAARLDVIIILSLWNVTGISAVLLPRCLSNFRAIGKVWTSTSLLRVSTRSCGTTSVRLLNRGTGNTLIWIHLNKRKHLAHLHPPAEMAAYITLWNPLPLCLAGCHISNTSHHFIVT